MSGFYPDRERSTRSGGTSSSGRLAAKASGLHPVHRGFESLPEYCGRGVAAVTRGCGPRRAGSTPADHLGLCSAIRRGSSRCTCARNPLFASALDTETEVRVWYFTMATKGCADCGRSLSRVKYTRCKSCEARRRVGTPEERFWNYVSRSVTCWLWLGPIQNRGYGTFMVYGRSTLAHRFAYELLVGPIPVGLTVDHKCRIRDCVNPDHLRLLTHTENSADGNSARTRKTHCPRGHPYNKANTRIYDGRRWCRVCDRRRSSRARSAIKDGIRGS